MLILHQQSKLLWQQVKNTAGPARKLGSHGNWLKNWMPPIPTTRLSALAKTPTILSMSRRTYHLFLLIVVRGTTNNDDEEEEEDLFCCHLALLVLK
mmetsp:Transcript_107508/g.301068  ORF Transcript_107508/g.301068 Transcript_107508/m.301068 type:complete len:96 (+) Transcript_107508:855-1142(+)